MCIEQLQLHYTHISSYKLYKQIYNELLVCGKKEFKSVLKDLKDGFLSII